MTCRWWRHVYRPVSAQPVHILRGDEFGWSVDRWDTRVLFRCECGVKAKTEDIRGNWKLADLQAEPSRLVPTTRGRIVRGPDGDWVTRDTGKGA